MTNRPFATFCLFGLLLLFGSRVNAATPHVVRQTGDGTINLDASDAQIQGPNARLEGKDEKRIVWWTHADTSLCWRVAVQTPGKYRVELTYDVIGNNNGSALAIVVGEQTVKAIPRAGAGESEFTTGQTGELTIAKPGDLQVLVKPFGSSHEFVLSVRSLALVPVEAQSNAVDISGKSIPAEAEGSFKLKATDASIIGPNAVLQGGGEANIGYWSDVGTSLAWSIAVQRPGKYRVEMSYALAEESRGSKIAVVVGDQTIKAKLKAGKDWKDYLTGRAGEVTIDQSGDIPVVVKALSKPRGYVMNLRSITLLPVDIPSQATDISDQSIPQSDDGSFELTAVDAEIDGRSAKMEGGEKEWLVWWNNSERSIKWSIKVDRASTFDVMLTYSMETGVTDTQIEIGVGDRTVGTSLLPGMGLDDFRTEKVGQVEIREPGDLALVLKATKASAARMMNLRSISLIPVFEN